MTKELELRQAQKAAAILWIEIMAAYALMGILFVFQGISLAFLVNILFSVICILFIFQKEQSLSSMGLARQGLNYSCKVGMVCATAIVLLNGVIPGILQGRVLAPPEDLLLPLAYYMFIIAVPEEIIFRGYLLTRLELSLKSCRKAVLVSGILFMLIHVPYQLVVSGMNPLAWLVDGNLFMLFMTFVWHLIFCWIFKKTKVLYGSILFHGFMDWSNVLFI